MEHTSVFVLGRTPLLAQAEITAVFPSFQTELTSPHILTTSNELPSGADLLGRLGGCIKLGELLTVSSTITPELLVDLLIPFAQENTLTFAVSVVDGALTVSLSQVKKELLHRGLHTVRFIEAKEGGMLSGGQVKEKGLIELLVSPKQEKVMISRILVNQNIDLWNERDYGRPHADARRGMLPTKVARMVLNLACGSNPAGLTVLDPFCGMGTILAEGYTLGVSGIGSDRDEQAISEAKENIDWLTTRFPSTADKPRLFVADAVHLSGIIKPETIDAIVTEPFLGDPSFAKRQNVTILEIQNTLKGLEKLYIGCLKEWNPLLKKNGKIVMALPSFFHQGRKHSVKRVVDSCENFGYSMSQGPFEYARPQAFVRREFYVLTKTNG